MMLISPDALPGAIAALSRARSLGTRPPPAEFESLMLSCVAHQRPAYAYRLMEEAAADGLRLADFSDAARSQLEGLLPPEAEETPGLQGLPPLEEVVGLRHGSKRQTPASSRRNGHNRFQSSSSSPSGSLIVDPLPSLWVAPATTSSLQSAKEFGCAEANLGGDQHVAALTDAWAAVARRDRPVLFRGVGAHWPALRTWTLDGLCGSLERGMVRVAPSSRVTFCRESHPDVRTGLLTPPSRTLIMGTAEFADRLHVGRHGRQPLLYGEGERCYMQALAPHSMMADLDFRFLADAAQPPLEEEEGEEEGEEGVRSGGGGGGGPSVSGRLWVSAPGTVSPLHYDNADSYLCQVKGAKRLVLWPKRVTRRSLEPFPSDHALARRLRVDVTGDAPPRRLTGPLKALRRRAVRKTAVEAVLQPGDVLYFPEGWAHHTEALHSERGEEAEPSFSLGFRTDGQYLL